VTFWNTKPLKFCDVIKNFKAKKVIENTLVQFHI